MLKEVSVSRKSPMLLKMCDAIAIPNPETKQFQGKAGVKNKLSEYAAFVMMPSVQSQK